MDAAAELARERTPMTPRATSEYHVYEQPNLFSASSLASPRPVASEGADPTRPVRGEAPRGRCLRRHPSPPLPFDAAILEEIATAAIPSGLVERHARTLAAADLDPLGGVGAEVVLGLVRAYKARLVRHAQDGVSLLHGGDHVAVVLDGEGSVADITVTLSAEIAEKSETRIAADLEGRLDQGGVRVHELLAEWLLVAAGLSRLDDGTTISRENESEIRGQLRDGMFDAFTASEVAPESMRGFSAAIAEMYLHASAIESLGVSEIETLAGLRDADEVMRPARLPEPIDDHWQAASAMLHVQVRDAVVQRRFERCEVSMFPTADISRRSRDGGGIRGSAQLLPPGWEEGRITPDQAQAWAGLLHQQASQLSDLDADVLDALWAVWLHQSGGDPNAAAVAKIDDLLRMRTCCTWASRLSFCWPGAAPSRSTASSSRAWSRGRNYRGTPCPPCASG